MRKIIITAAAIVCCGIFTSCGLGTTGGLVTPSQSGGALPSESQQSHSTAGGDILGAIINQAGSNNSILSDIISTFGGGITTNQNTILGTWKYSKPCVQFESESLLAKAGGTVAASKVEDKLTSIYQSAGIKPGSCTFVFNKDNTMKYTFGSKTYNGTYSFNASNKTMSMTSQNGVQVNAYVSVAGNNMGLTFDASKLLTFIGSSSLLSSGLSGIIGNYSGMKVGFEMSK